VIVAATRALHENASRERGSTRPSHVTERSLGATFMALPGRSMQYRASALPRIYLSPKLGG